MGFRYPIRWWGQPSVFFSSTSLYPRHHRVVTSFGKILPESTQEYTVTHGLRVLSNINLTVAINQLIDGGRKECSRRNLLN